MATLWDSQARFTDFKPTEDRTFSQNIGGHSETPLPFHKQEFGHYMIHAFGMTLLDYGSHTVQVDENEHRATGCQCVEGGQ